MSRLIDADALDMYECLRSYYGDAWRDAQKAIDDAPTVDAVPLKDYKSMEQTVNKLTKVIADAESVKHGHWMDEQRGRWIYAKCGLCGTVHDVRTNYCPHCGAKMDEVKECTTHT